MPGPFAKLTIRIADLNQAWQDRLDDALTLNAAGRYAGAIASGLYALEIYLKSRLCQRLNLSNLPKPLEIHDLVGLAIFAGFNQTLNLGSAPGNVKQNWDKLVEMSEELNDLRYFPAANWSQQQASDFFQWLADPNDGVIIWLKTQT